MYNYNYSNELYHHGVKGQRWGVITKAYKKVGRKSPKQAERAAEKTAKKKAKSEAKARIKIGGAKDLSKMSDADIKKAMERLRLEQSYKEMLGTNATQKGKQFAEKSGKQNNNPNNLNNGDKQSKKEKKVTLANINATMKNLSGISDSTQNMITKGRDIERQMNEIKKERNKKKGVTP